MPPSTENSPQKGLIVTSNEIVHAKYHFSLWQKRVFMYFVSLIDKDATEFGLQKVYIADLIRFFEAEQNGTVQSIIENVPRQLFETAIQVPYRDDDGNERFGEVRLITKYTKPQDRKPGNSYIELKFNEDLKPHLLDLKKQFSKYELRYIVHLQSAHAIRIYEILKSHQYRGQIELDVDFLKTILEVDNKYKLYGDFKRKIIDKAQQEMSANCDIGFVYDEIKSGKKVVTLRFTIFENKGDDKNAPRKALKKTSKAAAPPASGQPPSAEAAAEQDTLFLELQPVVIGEWGVSPTRLMELMKTHPAEQIRQAFRVTKRKAHTGGLNSKAGFFIEAIQKGFTDEQEQQARKKSELAAREAKRNAEAQELQKTLEDLQQAAIAEIHALIRNMVEKDAGIRTHAIEAIKRSQSWLIKREIEKLGDEPHEQAFRENAILREAVIWEIVAQNKAVFLPVSVKYGEQIKPIAAALTNRYGVKPNLDFTMKTFLKMQ